MINKRVEHYYRTHHDRFLEELIELLRIPSVSTLSEFQPHIRRAAEFLAADFRAIGLENVVLHEGRSGQNPLVYADWLNAAGKPTLLFYGHYDVQPPDPLSEWISPPFEPSIRGRNIFARGACDDKGQTYLMLKAVEGWLKADGRLPVNVKFLIEGEEEIGGGHIEKFIPRARRLLRADAAVICDTEMFAPGLPTLTTGLRGLVYMEIEARGAVQDLHSGMFGGAAPNPVEALARIIAGIKGPHGRIAIPGFYRSVQPPDAAELTAWKRLPFKESDYLRREVGSTALTGEKGFSVLERLWARPTLDVHGIRGGFTGEGAKTVIPALATAKVSMRLVPGMAPRDVVRRFAGMVTRLTPAGIRARVRVLSSAPASRVSTRNRFVEAAARAMDDVFRRKTVYVRSGGSIPVAGLLGEHLKIPVIMMGFGLPDDHLHAPNEKFYLPNFFRGIKAVGRMIEVIGE